MSIIPPWEKSMDAYKRRNETGTETEQPKIKTKLEVWVLVSNINKYLSAGYRFVKDFQNGDDYGNVTRIDDGHIFYKLYKDTTR